MPRAGRARGPAPALLAVAFALGACGEEPAPAPGPPAAPHGAVVLEPGELAVGDLLTVEILVVTPADHGVRPVQLPEQIPPLWLLDAERLPVRREGERWIHGTRVRARVREAPGDYAWPPLRAEVETPAGALLEVELAGRPFTVVSVAGEHPGQHGPFGLRMPEAPAAPGGFWVPALLGSATTLLALGGLGLARRRRARARARAREPAPDPTPPWVAAGRALDAALARVESDPRAAGDEAAMALRRYVHRRADRPVESLTTEEIAAQRAPGRLRSRWPELVALLRRLDALRFPGDLDRSEGRAALRAALEDARAFVASSAPPRELR